MKHFLFAAIAVLLLTCTVQAQSIYPGFKGGLNIYNVMGDQPTMYVPKFSYHLGMFTHIHLQEKLALQPELVYSAQGARYEGSGNDLRLKYFNVPVLAQYMFGNGLRLEAGPQLGLLAS